MNHLTRVRESVFAAAAALLLGIAIEGQAQSPSTIGGRTIQLTISSGTFPFASSGQYRFLPSSVDSGYAIVPVSGDVGPSTGTHTYTKTGANTARLSLVDSEVGGLTVNCTFSTATSGTYTVTSAAFPGSSQSGTFILYAGSSPTSITGSTVTVTITSGELPFATWGSYRFLPAASGSTYNVVALSGDVGDSSGTYSYSKNSDYTGIVSFTDSVVGSGFTYQLSFDSPTTGTLLLRKSGSTGYQTGLFTMTTPSVPPSISVHPASQTVNVGASATFTVSASGTAPLAYQWRKNGINIAGANAASYTISSAQATEQGAYDVIVSNSGGFATSSVANLTVVSPPSIVSHPAGQTVNVGSGVTFSVTATGTGPLGYQWRKDGVMIVGATNAAYSISNASFSDGGFYQVLVRNPAGNVTSSTAQLIVQPAIETGAPKILSQPQGIQTLEGRSVALGVVAVGDAPLTYTWTKNGDVYSAGAGLPTLVFISSQPADSGIYRVTVSNGSGSLESRPMELRVHKALVVPPQAKDLPPIQSNGFRLLVDSVKGVEYVVEATTDLAGSWVEIHRFTSNGEALDFLDEAAKAEVRRFYRVRQFTP